MLESIPFWLVIFVISLGALVKATDYFLEASEGIGMVLGLPSFIVGVTLVAIGTSFPELATSIAAVLNGASEIVVSNVVGSNIANIFLVLGTAAVFSRTLKVTYSLVRVDLPILTASAFLLAVTTWDRHFGFIEGIFFICAGFIYVHYILTSALKSRNKKAQDPEYQTRRHSQVVPKLLVKFGISAIVICIGSKFTVESVVRLSVLLNMGKEIIAMSAVALGTSLPELVVSLKAAKKGNAELAVGNILGSNIFNTFIVMGIPALFGALIIPQTIISFGLPLMIIATLLYFFVTQDREITKWEGGILLIFYVIFLGKLFKMF